MAFLDPPGTYDGSPLQAHIWVRRALPTSSAPITGTLFESADSEAAKPGTLHHFRVVPGKAVVSNPEVRRQWPGLLAGSGLIGQSTPWGAFAYWRLRSLAEAGLKGSAKTSGSHTGVGTRSGAPRDDLARLMETTTGATAIQEALQNDRALFARAAHEAQSIPIEALKGPPLASHPWKRMLAGAAPPVEVLASDVPAEFYYVRSRDLSSLYRVLDEVDAWGTPATGVLDGAVEDRGIAARYESELALVRGPLTRALGDAVVGEVAIVGSDPYVREGSDVTVLLRVKNRPLVETALAVVLADLERDHGAVSRSKRTHAGFEVSVARSKDGAVAQQRASVGDVEVISNSAGSMDLVLDACHGEHATLANEPDFQFMLARDARTQGDVLGYMGDRFVSAVVGPKQKVLEARRQMALGELMTPGFAALLYGWLQGKSPTKVEDLFALSLLSKVEMAHAGGEPIVWHPGEAARSSWGTPAALTPLMDLPAALKVTASEKAGYEAFARSYQYRWASYIDPVAVRVAFAPGSGRGTMTVDVRELPLIGGSEYREMADFVGGARFIPPAPSGGVRTVVGVGAKAWPREEPREHFEGDLVARDQARLARGLGRRRAHGQVGGRFGALGGEPRIGASKAGGGWGRTRADLRRGRRAHDRNLTRLRANRGQRYGTGGDCAGRGARPRRRDHSGNVRMG